MKYSRFEELPVWNLAADLAAIMFEWTTQPSFRGKGDLANQIQRATLSISNNIAEGFGRGSDAEFARFLSYSRGSAMEVISCLHVLVRIGLFTAEEAAPLHQLATLCLQQVSRLQGYLTPGRVREDNLEAYHAL